MFKTAVDYLQNNQKWSTRIEETFATTEIAAIKIEKVIESEKTKIASENATTKIAKGIETTTKIVTVAIIETIKILPETVIVREENAKGKDHAVALVVVIEQQEDVDPDPGNEINLNYVCPLIHFFLLIRSPRDRRDRKDVKTEQDAKDQEASEENTEQQAIKKEPLSLEELLAKKKAEEEEKSKPKFLTKEERAAEAMRKRQEEVENLRKQQEEERSKRNAFFQV
jgi:hypothetical protein